MIPEFVYGVLVLSETVALKITHIRIWSKRAPASVSF